eukprot:TRINITY_DN44561_c0_g1_i3.p1 TRINITY_DN44561_c0_g1~~TRINITY_DN44561_c0_g1_i3.p1  ORF type:complete len:763 (+),score=117.68 TRINITY_DN44561_c0_g1_i3:162-2450(+)
MSSTATQLTITIPEGAPAGSILSIPVKGTAETIKARVPEGLGPGCTLILTKHAGSDQWIEETLDGSQLATVEVEGQYPLDQAHGGGVQANGSDLQPGLVPAGPVAHTVRLDTTVGVIDIIVRPDWAPHGARRFLELAAAGDLEDLAFYRAVKGCLAQFGLPARRQWPPLPDDPPTGVPFLLGAVCFAAVGQNSRKSTLFICTGDMSHCFGQSSWETPIGAVAESSLDALDRIETCYGDIAECGGAGPNTGRIHDEGTAYLRQEFPRLTHIRQAWPLDWAPDEAMRAGWPPLLPQRRSLPPLQPQSLAAQHQAAVAAGTGTACSSSSRPAAAATVAAASVVQAEAGLSGSRQGVLMEPVATTIASRPGGGLLAPGSTGIVAGTANSGFAGGLRAAENGSLPPARQQVPVDVPIEIMPRAAKDVHIEVRQAAQAAPAAWQGTGPAMCSSGPRPATLWRGDEARFGHLQTAGHQNGHHGSLLPILEPAAAAGLIPVHLAGSHGGPPSYTPLPIQQGGFDPGIGPAGVMHMQGCGGCGAAPPPGALPAHPLAGHPLGPPQQAYLGHAAGLPMAHHAGVAPHGHLPQDFVGQHPPPLDCGQGGLPMMNGLPMPGAAPGGPQAPPGPMQFGQGLHPPPGVALNSPLGMPMQSGGVPQQPALPMQPQPAPQQAPQAGMLGNGLQFGLNAPMMAPGAAAGSHAMGGCAAPSQMGAPCGCPPGPAAMGNPGLPGIGPGPQLPPFGVMPPLGPQGPPPMGCFQPGPGMVGLY